MSFPLKKPLVLTAVNSSLSSSKGQVVAPNCDQVNPVLCMPCCAIASGMSDGVTLWTAACQGPLSMEFSWQQYWNGLPFPLPGGNLPDPRIKPTSLTFPALKGRFFATSAMSEPRELPDPSHGRATAWPHMVPQPPSTKNCLLSTNTQLKHE